MSVCQETLLEFFKSVIDLFLHLDTHLTAVAGTYGTWTYLILFLIVFCETGLVVTPFLPGDSLLFAAGALAAIDGSPLSVGCLFVLLVVAAIASDTVNYWVGNYVGPRIFHQQRIRFLNKEHLEKTNSFYEKNMAEKQLFWHASFPLFVRLPHLLPVSAR